MTSWLKVTLTYLQLQKPGSQRMTRQSSVSSLPPGYSFLNIPREGGRHGWYWHSVQVKVKSQAQGDRPATNFI